MCRRLLIIAGSFLCFTLAASAQTPSPDAILAARSLVTTMKLGEQYKMLLPAILLRIKPVVTQERAELESDYDLIAAKAGDVYAPYYNDMLEQAATVYAANFTVDEMRQMEAFLRQPAGQKLIEKWPAIAQQTAQIGQDVSRNAAEELRLRLTDALARKVASELDFVSWTYPSALSSRNNEGAAEDQHLSSFVPKGEKVGPNKAGLDRPLFSAALGRR